MTTNPLAQRASSAAQSTTIYSDVHAYCAHLNANLKRGDIEWVVSESGGLYLQDRQDWSIQNTKVMRQRAEDERQRWIRRWRYPVTEIDQAA